MQDADALEQDDGVNKVMSSTQRDHNEDKIQFLWNLFVRWKTQFVIGSTGVVNR